MAEWTRGAKVGLFALVCVGAGYGIWKFINPSAGTSGGYTVHAYLNDASGLATYSRVMVAGIPIGNVSGIRLEHGKARVDVKVRPEIALHTDASLSKRASSLLGEFVIVIGQGNENQPTLHDGDEIKNVIEPTTTDQILKDVGEIAEQVKAVSKSLAGSIGTDKGEKDIQATLANLAEVTDSLNKAIKENRESIRRIVLNVEGISGRSGPEIQQILENVRVITSEVRTLVSENQPDGQKGPMGAVRNTVDNLNKASVDLQAALAHVNSITGRIDRGEGTIGKLTKDETLINEVNNVVEGVGDFVGGISRTQTVIGLRNDYNFQSNTIKSYLELRLQPREDKYYAIELINDPRGKTSFEQVDVDTTNPNQPPHYREIRTTTSNAFRFSFQFARRIGPLTGRFGIKESTGGVGLDLHLLQDRFEIRQDLFGFGEQLQPRWRFALSYEFLRRLWLISGVDDIFNRDRRDYFLGLQLRFIDEDLKSILPFAPKM
ncbi:MAG: MCE family protein [Deltaproteobacteria bacterium]|nr:MCE family protein [Deltaproteobacteria bacterium]